jgi:hypothetical protein
MTRHGLAPLPAALFIVASACAPTSSVETPADDPVLVAIIRYLASDGGWSPAADAAAERPTLYSYAEADLDRDAAMEVVAHITGPQWCGSGGCTTLILDEGKCGLSVAYRIPVANPPIRTLSTSSNGMRDLAVLVTGGGVAAHYAPARFDGQRYVINWENPAESGGVQVLAESVAGKPLVRSGELTPADCAAE